VGEAVVDEEGGSSKQTSILALPNGMVNQQRLCSSLVRLLRSGLSVGLMAGGGISVPIEVGLQRCMGQYPYVQLNEHIVSYFGKSPTSDLVVFGLEKSTELIRVLCNKQYL
jgi:hypothetical protein